MIKLVKHAIKITSYIISEEMHKALAYAHIQEPPKSTFDGSLGKHKTSTLNARHPIFRLE